MSLWQRAPREVYRVYGEDQYLEGETAAEGEGAPREDAATVEADSRAGASWAAAEVPPRTARTGGGSSARSSVPHAGRLVGVGMLVGVSLATLVLVFLNASRPRGAATEPLARVAGVEGRQRMTRKSGAASVSPIAPSDSSSPAQAPRSSTSSAMAPAHPSRWRVQERLPAVDGPDPAPRLERTWSAALRSSGNPASARDVVESPTPVTAEPFAQVAVEPPVQDEFGFER
jgi:hypothetical protein